MEKNRSFGKTLVVIILVLAILGGIGWVVYTKFFKDKNKGVTGTEVELAAYAINKTHKANEEIANAYEKSSVASSSSSLFANNAMYAGTSTYADESLTLEEIDLYFEALSMCFQIPSVIDFVVNSSTSSSYANTFELDKTYFATIKDGGNSNVLYYQVKKEASKVTLFYGGYDIYLVCQIEYDFENDKLISAKTMNSFMSVVIDYSTNEMMGCGGYSIDEDVATLNKVMNGEFDYDDIANVSSVSIFRGNIANTINQIEFEMTEFDGSESTKLLFNNHIKRFNFGITTDDFFDFSNPENNNSFVDAIYYSERRLEYIVRVNPNNPYEYQYIPTWIDYEEVLSMLDKVPTCSALQDNANARYLATAYKNRLEQRGKGAYTGANQYIVNNDSISINKSTEDVNTYIISIMTEGNVIEFCCKYENSTLTVLNDNSYLGVNITAIASEDGTYAIITKYETLGSIVSIPSTYNIGGTDLPVKALGDSSDYDNYFTIESKGNAMVCIPSSVESITLDSWLDVVSFSVDTNNEHYASHEGVLYTKNMQTLVQYPNMKGDKEYEIPNGVKYLRNMQCEYLETLIVPASLQEGLDTSTFWCTFSLKNVNVSGGNTTYSSYNGVVYSADGKEAIFCPAGKSGSLTIKSGTERIGYYMFGYCENLTEIIIPEGVTEIEDNVFELCHSLERLVLPSTITTISSYGIDFDGAYKLNTIEIGSGSTVFSKDSNGLLYNADKTVLYFVPRNISGTVTLPATVEYISDYAFERCNNVTKITVLGDSVSFNYSPFEDCNNLTEILFNGFAEKKYYNDYMDFEIYRYSFSDCPSLTTIRFNGTKAQWQSKLESGNNPLYVSKTLTVKCTDGDITYTPINN